MSTTTIHLSTPINGTIQEVFDAARNIDLHIESAKKTKEKAIAGTISGLINLHETVTWKGKHFGVYLTHQSKITSLESPTFFIDEMIQGHFKTFKHQHLFKSTKTETIMIDILTYETPYGIFGKAFDRFILKRHLTAFLSSRNYFIKTKIERS